MLKIGPNKQSTVMIDWYRMVVVRLIGGLIVSMYHRKGMHGSKIDALVFNSPFFALNLPKVVRKAVSLKHSTIGLGKGLEPVSKVNSSLLEKRRSL